MLLGPVAADASAVVPTPKVPASLTNPLITAEVIPIICSILGCESLTTSQMKNLCGDGNGAFRYTASFKVALTQRFSILGDAYATLLNNLSKTDSGVSSNIVKK